MREGTWKGVLTTAFRIGLKSTFYEETYSTTNAAFLSLSSLAVEKTLVYSHFTKSSSVNIGGEFSSVLMLDKVLMLLES